MEFSERLAGLLPAPLDTVFLVNSGSEAVDLALRLALVATGRRDVVAVREAYHGWTYAEVRRHGGLAIADEIQVGYGRLGHWFWGFEQQGVGTFSPPPAAARCPASSA